MLHLPGVLHVCSPMEPTHLFYLISAPITLLFDARLHAAFCADEKTEAALPTPTVLSWPRSHQASTQPQET